MAFADGHVRSTFVAINIENLLQMKDRRTFWDETFFISFAALKKHDWTDLKKTLELKENTSKTPTQPNSWWFLSPDMP